MNGYAHYDVIRSPVITERSTALSEHNQVVFKVAPDAKKGDKREVLGFLLIGFGFVSELMAQQQAEMEEESRRWSEAPQSWDELKQFATDLPDAAIARGVLVWAAVFGCVSFEVFGQTHNVVEDHARYFDAAVERLADLVPLP